MSHWLDRLARASVRRETGASRRDFFASGAARGADELDATERVVRTATGTLASRVSRRRAFGLAGGAAAALATASARPRSARAQDPCGDGPVYPCGDDGTCCMNGDLCCLDSEKNFCCPAGQECQPEGRCCPSAQVCEHLCCNEGASCCGEGSAVQCCDPPNRCGREVPPGASSAPPGSPPACCPPERQPQAAGNLCCSPGYEGEQTGRLVVTIGNGGSGSFCCPQGNLCAGSCCTGSANFPTTCASGPDGKYCAFKDQRITSDRVRAKPDGKVPIKLSFKSPSKGQLKLQTAGGGASRGAGASPLPTALGSARFRVRKRGKKQVEVRLSRAGRKLLKQEGRLQAEAELIFEDKQATLRTWTPITLQKPRRRG
jgi:hypothetical protein